MFWRFAKNKIFVALWTFSMGVNGKILKCAISWKTAHRRVKRTKMWDLRWYILCYVEYFSCLILWVQFEVIGCTLQNSRCYDFQKATAPTIFIQFQPNFIIGMLVVREYKLLLFLAICRNLKILWYFEDKLPQLHCQYPWIYAGFIWQMVKQSVKARGPLVIRSEPNFMMKKAVTRECKVIMFWRSAKKIRNLWHFKF